MNNDLREQVQDVLYDELLTDGQYETIKSLIRTATLDDVKEAVEKRLFMYPNHHEARVKNDAMRDAIKAIDNLRGNDDG